MRPGGISGIRQLMDGRGMGMGVAVSLRESYWNRERDDEEQYCKEIDFHVFLQMLSISKLSILDYCCSVNSLSCDDGM